MAPTDVATFRIPETSAAFVIVRGDGRPRCLLNAGGGEGFLLSSHLDVRGSTDPADCHGANEALFRDD